MAFQDDLLKVCRDYKKYTDPENREISYPFVDFDCPLDKIKDGGEIFAVVGPSGSGKSTFISNLYANGILGNLNTQFVPYLNRSIFGDKLSQQRGLPKKELSKDLYYISDEIEKKKQLAAQGKSFLLESAKFDKTYVEFLMEMQEKFNTKIHILYLTTESLDENLHRVKIRKVEGGFGFSTRELNPDHVKEQRESDADSIRKLAPYCENLFIFDNSAHRPMLVGQKIGKDGVFEAPKCKILFSKLANAVFPITSANDKIKKKFVYRGRKRVSYIDYSKTVVYPLNTNEKSDAVNEVAATVMPKLAGDIAQYMREKQEHQPDVQNLEQTKGQNELQETRKMKLMRNYLEKFNEFKSTNTYLPVPPNSSSLQGPGNEEHSLNQEELNPKKK